MAKNASEKKSVEKVESRRSQIIKLVQQGKWTTEKLAEKLQKLNSDWETTKNKTAISGTLADLKKKGWMVDKEADGVIKVEVVAAIFVRDSPLRYCSATYSICFFFSSSMPHLSVFLS